MNKYISDIVGETIKCVYLHPVKCIHVFQNLDYIKSVVYDKVLDRALDEALKVVPDRREVYLTQLKRELANKIKPEIDGSDLTWDAKVWDGVTKLRVFSEKTGNRDICGGGCGDLDLSIEDFQWECENPNGITLRDLTEAIYRMKGSKYDYCHELFSYIYVDIKDDLATVEVDFSYEN